MSHLNAKLSDYRDAREALADLYAPFVGGGASVPSFRDVEPERIPEPFRKLLVHHQHMTVVLQEHHGQPVRLKVLRQRIDGDAYRREIVLTRGDSDRIVEYGIVRMDLGFLSEEVREQILDRRTPLGDVLIAHDVLRRIEPRWYLCFPEGCGQAPGAANGPLYGRVGTIYVERQPAIELLEVVTGA